jgi:integrase
MYLEDNKDRLAPVTLKNRKARLRKQLAKIEASGENPSLFFDLVKGDMSAYSLKTLMLEISNWYKWAVREGLREENLWSREVAKRAQYFKGAYQPKRLEMTYDEVVKKIDQIEDNKVREAAREILRTGVRISEVRTASFDKVTGKASKVRKFYGDSRKFEGVSKHQIRRGLKKVGLVPHDLRKMFATRLARSGKFDDVTLCEVMGWESFDTARSYLQPEKQSEIANKIKDIL